MPFRIGINASGLSMPHTGLKRYVASLIDALAARLGPAAELPLLDDDPVVRDHAHTVSVEHPTARVTGHVIPPPRFGPFRAAFWHYRTLPAALDGLHLNVFHDPNQLGPFLTPLACPGVFTLHDLIPLQFPRREPLHSSVKHSLLLPRMLAHADRVIVPSQYTADCVAERFPAVSGKVRVVHHGLDPVFRPLPFDEAYRRLLDSDIKVPQRFLLTIGARPARRDLSPVFEALAQLHASGDRRPLVVLAPAPSAVEVPERVRDWCRIVSGVPDAVLCALYAAAEVFVFVSAMEGFGFPPLEAMACGTPTVAVATGSVPEVCGDGAMLVDAVRPPASLGGALAAAVGTLDADAPATGALIERGRARAAAFTWERCAHATLAVYREAMEVFDDGG